METQTINRFQYWIKDNKYLIGFIVLPSIALIVIGSWKISPLFILSLLPSSIITIGIIWCVYTSKSGLYKRLPGLVIFLALGALILSFAILLLGENLQEGSIPLMLFTGLYIFGLYASVILMGAGVVLGIIHLIEAHRK